MSLSGCIHVVSAGNIKTTLNDYVEMIEPCPVSGFYGITCVIFLNMIAEY